MNDSLLTNKNKSEIITLINSQDYKKIISILEKIKSSHAGTAKTKDKRFVIKGISDFINENSRNPEKEFFNSGISFCNMKEDVAKEIGISLIWKGFKHKPDAVKKQLLKIADDTNWEVREYAGSAFAGALHDNPGFYEDILEWTNHPSENVRRAVVFSAIGLRDEKNYRKAFKIFKPLMYDNSRYVKKNLGPFILGCYYGHRFPVQILNELKKWSNIKNEHVRWNIIMSFNNSFGNKYPDDALNVLSLFFEDENKTVRRALKSTLNHLSKRHKVKVLEFKKKNGLDIS